MIEGVYIPEKVETIWQPIAVQKKGKKSLTGFLQCGGNGDRGADAHHIWRDTNHGASPQDPHHWQTPSLHRRPPANQHGCCAVAHLAGVTWESSEVISCAQLSSAQLSYSASLELTPLDISNSDSLISLLFTSKATVPGQHTVSGGIVPFSKCLCFNLNYFNLLNYMYCM